MSAVERIEREALALTESERAHLVVALTKSLQFTANRSRKWFQFHPATVVLVSLEALIIMLLNVYEVFGANAQWNSLQPVKYGWPLTAIEQSTSFQPATLQFFIPSLLLDLLIFVVILAASTWAIERLIRRLENWGNKPEPITAA